jgi:internalin A
VVYGEVMTEEEVLQVIVQARRENATILDLSAKGLTSLPSTIGQLTDLRTLDLRNNRLKRLSEVIGQLSALEELYLYENQLTSLPESIGQLKSLTILGLSDNQLINLPSEIERLKGLKILFLSGNNLTRFPTSIGKLVNLVRLSLSENSLTDIPPEIGQLANLQRLDIVSNKLLSLPESIGQLTNLRFLHLADNQLTSLPRSIEQLANLQEINILGNPLQNVSPSSLSNQKIPVQQEITRITKPVGSASKLNEVKMVLLGQPKTGKTSILKRLVHDQFTINESFTDGLSIEKWHLGCSTAVKSDDQSADLACLNVWDFGGLENLHTAHQIFMTERSLYLLVIDNNASEEQNRIEYWLQVIGSFAKNSPVLIVGNKNDQAPLENSYHQYQQKYQNIKGFVSVSCQNASGIKDLRQHILQELANFCHVQTSCSPDWLAVKNNLESLNKGYITYAEYCQFCIDCNVVAASEQQTLIELLHDLGVILNFPQNRPIGDNPVMNTGWIMHGIYKILNDHFLVSECKGILAERMLTRILTTFQSNKREFTYTPAKHRFVLEMMMKLELCCEMIDQRSFLIPDLLPREELSVAHLDKWSGALQFQYRYPVFPHSIISRLIVRCSKIIDGNFFWRHGVVLKSADNRALIKSDRQEKTISIYVTGSPNSQRSFLKKIRQQITEIHQIFGAFDVDAYVPLTNFPAAFVSYQQLIDSQAEGVDVIVPQGLRQKVNVCELLNTIDVIPVSLSKTPTLAELPLIVNGNGRAAVPVAAAYIPDPSTHVPEDEMPGARSAIAKNHFVGHQHSYPAVTEQQLREVQGIALRLVKGYAVDDEVDLLSDHLRAPLADAIQHLLGLPAPTLDRFDFPPAPEKTTFQSTVIEDPFL